MNKATMVDVLLIIVGAFLVLFLVEGIRADLAIINGCRGFCYEITMFTAPFGVVGFALSFLVYYRRKIGHSRLAPQTKHKPAVTNHK